MWAPSTSASVMMMIAAVAQILVAVVRAGAAAERLREIGELLVLRELVLAGGRDVEDLAAQRQDRLRGAIARLFGRAAGGVALDDEQSPSPRPRCWCSRRACRAGAACAPRSCARCPFPARRRIRSSARSTTKSNSLLACTGLPASQWSNGSLIACSTMRCASAVASRSLVWPWNSGSRMKAESMAAAPAITSSLVIAAARLPWPTRSA